LIAHDNDATRCEGDGHAWANASPASPDVPILSPVVNRPRRGYGKVVAFRRREGAGGDMHE
jgi:hypothetical protein